MTENQKPKWQPISFLPLIAEMIDGMWESSADNLKSLKKAEPASLDEATVARTIKVYTNLHDDLWLYEKQLKMWQTGPMDNKQAGEIACLQNRLIELRIILEEILAMKEKLEKMTIEHLLSKSHLELGLDALLGKNKH